jgi:hypothetical protein
MAMGIEAEDSSNDCRFGGIDPATTTYRFTLGIALPHHGIAVGEPACRTAFADSTAQPAPRLVGEILQEEGVHRPLQSDMQLTDLAFGECEQLDPSEAKSLEEPGDVFEIARETVERLGYDDVEPPAACVFKQLLIRGPKCARAAHGAIGVGLEICPALLIYPLAAEPHLILDRRLALKV